MHPTRAWFLALVALFAIERLAEMVVSRRNLGASRDPGAAGRGNFAAMVGVHVLLLALPAIEVVVLEREPVPALFWTALALLVAAQALRYWSIATLGRAWNARAVVDPSRGFVASGPYRWMRHPNYLAVVVEFLALPLAGSAWIAWVALNLAHAPVLARRIRAEERMLATIPGYASAMHQKGGLWPRARAHGRHRAGSEA